MALSKERGTQGLLLGFSPNHKSQECSLQKLRIHSLKTKCLVRHMCQKQRILNSHEYVTALISSSYFIYLIKATWSHHAKCTFCKLLLHSLEQKKTKRMCGCFRSGCCEVRAPGAPPAHGSARHYAPPPPQWSQGAQCTAGLWLECVPPRRVTTHGVLGGAVLTRVSVLLCVLLEGQDFVSLISGTLTGHFLPQRYALNLNRGRGPAAYWQSTYCVPGTVTGFILKLKQTLKN